MANYGPPDGGPPDPWHARRPDDGYDARSGGGWERDQPARPYRQAEPGYDERHQESSGGWPPRDAAESTPYDRTPYGSGPYDGGAYTEGTPYDRGPYDSGPYRETGSAVPPAGYRDTEPAYRDTEPDRGHHRPAGYDDERYRPAAPPPRDEAYRPAEPPQGPGADRRGERPLPSYQDATEAYAGTPVPPRRRRRGPMVAVLAAVLLFVLGGGGLMLYLLNQDEQDRTPVSAPGGPTPAAPDAGLPGGTAPQPSAPAPESSADPRFVKAGECVRNDGQAGGRPKLLISECVPASYEVLRRFDGETSGEKDAETKCAQVPGYTNWYFFDSELDTLDFVLCLRQR